MQPDVEQGHGGAGGWPDSATDPGDMNNDASVSAKSNQAGAFVPIRVNRNAEGDEGPTQLLAASEGSVQLNPLAFVGETTNNEDRTNNG